MEYVVGLAFGLSLFILPLWAYRRGLKDGLSLQQGKPIAPISIPLPKKPQQTQEDKIAEGLANLLAYDGTPQEVKHGAD